MPETKYFFQRQKRNIAQRFFEKGLNATTCVLFIIGEQGKLLLSEMPSSYPAFGIMKKTFNVYPYNRKQIIKKQTINVSLHRLKKQGLIAQDPKKKVYCLTDKGKELTLYIKNRYAVLTQPWDGKLRIVIFDIPEIRKQWRRRFRQELVLLQFQQLQKSVYIGKHPLPQSLYKDIAEQGFSECIFILTVGDIDRKKKILKMFEQSEEN